LIFGVASEDSIAWAVARELASQGASITLGYQKRFLSRVMQLVKDQTFIEKWEQCDLADEESTRAFFSKLTGEFSGIVHSVAFAPPDALAKPIYEVTEEEFAKTLTVSSYSLARVVRHALPKLSQGSGVVAMTYLGSERVVPNYQIMGTAKAALESLTREIAAAIGPQGYRMNAVSAGPLRTLAASAVPSFNRILEWVGASSPLRRNVTQTEVARVVRFLLSDDASAVTGQVLYADAGYSILGAPNLEVGKVESDDNQ
jgi:enoyl-[acyl-carrier protein] reductase I